ncbi:cytochrome-c peroxidase [Chryseobacterium lactis]|uniref:Cytochrome-c peroxidase n=1 Tax=Chryseobacterium lactis TaxID=1241981 RepID=A0A3G6RQS4_CHRLC|nr:cytochrome-c peroxidase [Chryseobacterium lactis]AZA85092.1 cytochrome-c peroxidase [Chryseobacterium lactis]AZB07321.1 cytochrome-c peroxidase [Chryseobacterium lactis]PNW15816.1 cytochrome-c peroxidase [Chryseobacterium lactis]
MKKIFSILSVLILLISCNNDYYEPLSNENPEISLNIPFGFPELNKSVSSNKPTKYGIELGEKLFQEKRLSADNTISCSSCHIQSNAFADHNAQAIGIQSRVGLRNAPAVQNMMFMKFYNWDGNILQLEKQPLVPIITHEEMGSSILEVIGKIKDDLIYKDLFRKTFGDENVTPERIYKSIAQYEYTLVSANSKYDKIKRGEDEKFAESETQGYVTFQQKCVSCHSTELFTDQSFRNIGFPVNPNTNEAGRGRVTGIPEDYMSFRVPSLRNVEYTAPYGSFGQFPTLRAVLDYFDKGVLNADNLDPVFKQNGNRIPLTEQEKINLISFMKTLSDREFVKK